MSLDDFQVVRRGLDGQFILLDRVTDRFTNDIVNKRLIPSYRTALDSIQRDIAKLYERYSVDGSLSMNEVTKYARLAKLEEGIVKEMQLLGNRQVRTTARSIKDVYKETRNRTAYGIEREVQAHLGFGQLSPKQVEAALINPMDRIGWQTRTREQIRVATRQIRQEITQGIIQGKGYPEVARAVKHRLDMTAGRAERIVRTEGHRAREMGKLSAMEHAHNKGVEMEKVWSATLDKDTRDSHQGLDGQAVDMFKDGQPGRFTSPLGNQAEYPGGFGVAEEDIHCRCAMRGQVKGYSPEVRRRRVTKAEIEEGVDPITPYTRYPDYAKARGWDVKYTGPEPRVPVEYLRFGTEKEVVEFFEGKGGILERTRSAEGRWRQTLTGDEKGAVRWYTADGYADINNYHRKYGDWQNINASIVKDATRDLDNVISRFDLTDNIRTYRAINPDAFGGVNADLTRLVGTRYTDPAYMSTSPYMKSTAVNKDLIMQIDVPSGTGRGAYLDKVSVFHREEYEFLLPRNTVCEIYEISEIGGIPLIKMRVIPGG